MIKEKFDLTQIKAIAVDSAFYHVADLAEKNENLKISKILWFIKESGMSESMQARFKKLEAMYGLTKPMVDAEEPTENINISKNSLRFEELLYTREVQLKNDTYEVKVRSAILLATQEKVAVKTYTSINEEVISKFEKEIEILKMLSKKEGPFLNYYGSYIEKVYNPDYELDEHELGIVMEFCPKTLAKQISIYGKTKKKFTEAEFENIISSLLGGFIIMGDNYPKIYHQDIKPDNIYFSANGKVLIGDFNISTVNAIREVTATVGISKLQGTTPYMAPEIYKIAVDGKGKYRKSKADVYSFGVTLLQMCTCEANTYNEPSMREARNKKISQIPLIWLRNMINDSLIDNYRERASFKELLAYLPMKTVI